MRWAPPVGPDPVVRVNRNNLQLRSGEERRPVTPKAQDGSLLCRRRSWQGLHWGPTAAAIPNVCAEVLTPSVGWIRRQGLWDVGGVRVAPEDGTLVMGVVPL